MDQQRHGMLSIGGFASAAQLSLKALRLYDQLGLLKPSYVDRGSGYRYYHPDQLSQARLIRLMRQMEMPLATIRQVLAAAPAEAAQLVQGYWQARQRRMEQARRIVDDLLAMLREEVPAMMLDVRVKTVAPQPIISVTRRVKVEQLGDHMQASLRQLHALAEQQGNGVTGAPFGIYHGPVNHDDDGPMEVCLPVRAMAQPTDDVAARELPGGTVAYVLLQGEHCEFPRILEGYDAVYDWIRQNGYETLEPPREVWYHQHTVDEQIEVAWLFRDPAAG